MMGGGPMSVSLNVTRAQLVVAIALVGQFAGAQANGQTTGASSSAVSASSASSQSTESKTKLDDVVKQQAPEKKDGEKDVDEVITNRKLRAEVGAKKTLSFSTSLNYAGGSVKSPGAEVRPNITAALGTQTAPKLSGTVGMKWKIAATHTISASLGVGIDKPFHSDDKKSFGERSYANNPSAGYTTVYKVAGVQNVSSLSASLLTSDFYKTVGYMGAVGGTQTVAYDFGGSKLSLGASVSGSAYAFDKDDAKSMRSQGDFGVGAFPFVEYVISDMLNFRTLIGFMADHSRTTPDFWTWQANTVYQSMGLGISVARDIYLYPNVQFIPEDIRDDRTNVALSATINL